MKKQELRLTVVDHRYDPPKENSKVFRNHKAYLRAMAEAVDVGGGSHVSEQTESRVEIFPHHQGGLFQ